MTARAPDSRPSSRPGAAAGHRGEAIGIAVALVGAYLAANIVVLAVATWHVVGHPARISHWAGAHGPLQLFARA
ncbi:hypothetical protein ACWDZ8_17920 [Streptomyces sp. NPDC003233]